MSTLAEQIAFLKGFKGSLHHAEDIQMVESIIAKLQTTSNQETIIKNAARWKKAVDDKEFPICRIGKWMHIDRITGKILVGDTPEEVIDLALDSVHSRFI